MNSTSVRLLVLGAVAVAASACSSDPDGGPVVPPTTMPGLPAQPQIVSPATGTQTTTDTPNLIVQNAQGFDGSSAQYAFRVTTASGAEELYSATVPGGSGQTSHTVTEALPRGMLLSWSVVARNAGSEVASAVARFRGPSVSCAASGDVYGKSVVDWFIPACSQAQNLYNDPEEVLGPPNSSGTGPNMFTGFVSLGDGGYVTVDMQICAADRAGADVRVYQRASAEPVTLYAAGQPEGPFVLLEARKPCGNPSPGLRSGHCDFDLALGEVEVARYFKIEDGELYPCPGDTVSEGADVDAIQILNRQ